MPDDKPSGHISKNVQLTLFRMGSLPSLAIYVGLGALLHAMFVGPQFDWSSAWTWGWLLGWPVALFIAFWGVILAIALVGIVFAVGVVIFESDTVSRWRNARMMRRAAKRGLKRRT